MRIEDIDLQELAQAVRARAPAGEPRGYLRGKTTMRELVIGILGCSALEAEELVDLLEARGYAQFSGNPSERSEAYSSWTIDPRAEL